MLLKGAFAAGCIALGAGLSAAQPSPSAPFPGRTLHFIVPFPAGGTLDVLARAVGNELGPVVRIGDVARDGDHPRQPGGGGAEGDAVPGVDDHGPAPLGERPGESQAQTLRGAGDDGCGHLHLLVRCPA